MRDGVGDPRAAGVSAPGGQKRNKRPAAGRGPGGIEGTSAHGLAHGTRMRGARRERHAKASAPVDMGAAGGKQAVYRCTDESAPVLAASSW